MAEIRADFPPCAWKPDKGSEIRFAIANIEEDWANRIVAHERFRRPGARQECTGSRYRIWRVTYSAYNTQTEPGIDGPSVQYPDIVDRLCDACDTEETGTLTTPTRGPRRCMAKSYRRNDTNNERDSANVVFEFWEDNEDDATAQDFNQVSAAGRVKPLADEAVNWSNAAGVDSLSLADLNALANELEGLATAPGDYVEDVESKANAVVNAAQRVERTFSNEATKVESEAAKLLLDPQNARIVRQLRVVADAAKSASLQKAAAGAGATTVVTFARQMSIFDVAVATEQDAPSLITLNSDGQIPNLFRIPPNTPIKVFDDAQAA